MPSARLSVAVLGSTVSIVVLVLLSAWYVSNPLLSANDSGISATEELAWASVDGRTMIVVSEGDVIPASRKLDGTCAYSSIRTAMSGNVRSIATTFDHDSCSLVIVDIEANPLAETMFLHSAPTAQDSFGLQAFVQEMLEHSKHEPVD